MREAGGMARLQAGGKFRSKIDLWRDSPGNPWQAKKYRPGDWEDLVEPTLELAKWLEVRGSVTLLVKGDFHYAIKAFSNTGELELPERLDSIPDDSPLGLLLKPFSKRPGDWDKTMSQDVETKLRSYLDVNPGQAAAWQALTRVYILLDRYRESLIALNKAISIAPYEAEFHFDAAMIRITSVKDAVEPRPQLEVSSSAMTGRNLDELQRSYEENRATCINHLKKVLKSSLPDSKQYKEKARRMLDWCLASPAYNLNQSKEQDVLDKHELQFCGTVAANMIRELQLSDDSRLDFGVAIHLTALCLLMGWTMARRYPDKARLVLIRERLPTPIDAMNYSMRSMYEKAAYLKGLRGDEALLYGIESEVKSNFIRSREMTKMHQLLRSIGGEVKDNRKSNFLGISAMRLMPHTAPIQFEDIPTAVSPLIVFETLFGAMKDGIAYGLFAPNESLPEAISREIALYGIKEPFGVEESLEVAIQGYEEVLGVIR